MDFSFTAGLRGGDPIQGVAPREPDAGGPGRACEGAILMWRPCMRAMEGLMQDRIMKLPGLPHPGEAEDARTGRPMLRRSRHKSCGKP